MKSIIRMGGVTALVIGLVLANLAAPVLAAFGGPDAFGYYYVDSLRPGGPVYNFEDISGTGTPLTLGDATLSPAIPIGFPFNFYGNVYNQIYVCANGYLTFAPYAPNPGECPFPESALIPTADVPHGLIAGWWADLNPSSSLTDFVTHAPNGTVKYQVLGTWPNRRFIVQFTNILHYKLPSPNTTTGLDPTTMQFKLFEGTSYIEVHYQAAPASTTGLVNNIFHSAGIENTTGSVGLSYFYGQAALATPVAVRYYFNDLTPPVTTLLATPANPTNQTTAQFTFSATDAGSGVSGFRCNLDNGSYSPCSSPWTSGTLGNGSHTFSVYAIDYLGNSGSANPASYAWNVDTSAPGLPVLLSPLNGSNQDLADPTTLTFQWQAGPGITPAGYFLKINANPPIDVGNMTSYTGAPLNKGVKITWSVQAYDITKNHPSAYTSPWRFTIGKPMYLPVIGR